MNLRPSAAAISALLIVCGCYQPVGVRADDDGGDSGSRTGGSTGSSGHGCLCEDGYHQEDVPAFCTCVANTPCSEDADCPSDARCEVVACTVGPCPGSCVTNPCAQDADCPVGTRCKVAECLVPPCPTACVANPADAGETRITCASDADCPSGQYCPLCNSRVCNPSYCAP